MMSFLILPSCSQFEEFNENPNEPTIVSPEVLLTSSMRKSVNSTVTESFLLGNNAAQLTAKTLRTEVDTYNWNAFPTVWEELYESLTDINEVIDLAQEQGNQQMEGVATVWRAYVYSILTNAYGDIPYSEAIGGADNNFTPKYDEQSAIYADLLAQLDKATGMLGGSGTIQGDIIYGNDAAKWQKLANSLRMRLLMTASNQMSNAGSQFAAIYNGGNFISSNADNAALTYLNGFPNQFPTLVLKTGDFDAVALSQSLYKVFNQNKDPRLMRYARSNNGSDADFSDYSGAANGANSGDCPKNGSRLGYQYFNDPSQVPDNGVNLSDPQGIIMTYAEVEFLIAEAAAKGWISDDIESHYKNGIQASMEYHSVEASDAGWSDFEDFYQNSGVAYEQTTDIWEQKWIALFFHGLEPYFEVRRWYHESGMNWDGIPFLSPSCQNLNSDQLPMRFLYPGEEQSLNAANYNSAVSRIGGDDQNVRMWLVK